MIQGGTLVPRADVVRALRVDAAGRARVAGTFPTGIDGGERLYAQVLVLDHAGAGLLGLSAALELRVP